MAKAPASVKFPQLSRKAAKQAILARENEFDKNRGLLISDCKLISANPSDHHYRVSVKLTQGLTDMNIEKWPFWNPACVDAYFHVILYSVPSHLPPFLLAQNSDRQLFANFDANRNAESTDKYASIDALISAHSQIHRITTAHPKYAIIDFRIANGEQIETNILFYSSENDSILIASMAGVNVFLPPMKRAGVDKRRQRSLPKHLRMEMDRQSDGISLDYSKIAKFNFAPPHKVGVTHSNEVFLSAAIDEKIEHDLEIISTKGLCTLINGFYLHPWHGGSADHINSMQCGDILLQFMHWLLRNKCIIVPQSNDPRLQMAQLTFFELNATYKHMLELDSFEVVLKWCRFIEPQKCSIGRVPFALKAGIDIIQDRTLCAHVDVGVCPLFINTPL